MLSHAHAHAQLHMMQITAGAQLKAAASGAPGQVGRGKGLRKVDAQALLSGRVADLQHPGRRVGRRARALAPLAAASVAAALRLGRERRQRRHARDRL